MIQAIRDLANAFVPSGRLIELVDITLVSYFSLSLNCPQNNRGAMKDFTTVMCFILFCSL